ncbi:hypothetical protein K439DRAFT_1617928 [Ramaria rubella]|nr:hypothetical protein K439DRAFT_1617928 [Ramaria rubella]
MYKPSHWKACGMGVKLVLSPPHPFLTMALEATADNLTHVNIWQLGRHDDAAPCNLLWSHHLRNIVSEHLHLVGAKATTIMKEVVNQYRNPTVAMRPTNEPLQRLYGFPIFRRPTRKQILQMLPAITCRGRLDQDPFTALTILHERNPEKVYNYTPHDSTKPDSESHFTCALADDFTVKNMILHGMLDGMAADTSWRNKSENRAAVTFLIAVNKNEHFVPVYVSTVNVEGRFCPSFSKGENQDLEYKSCGDEEKGQSACAGNCKWLLIWSEDPASIMHTDAKARAEILNICLEILKHGWKVPKWMIDKCLAELKAIKKGFKEFPDAYIRLCQFHVVQAILHWDTDDGTAVKKPRLPFYIKDKLIVLFCVLQRCRTMDEWPATKSRFLEDACGVVMSQGGGDADSDTSEYESEQDEELEEHDNPRDISSSDELLGKLSQLVLKKKVQGPKTEALLAQEYDQQLVYRDMDFRAGVLALA